VAITLVGSHQNRHSSASPSTGAIPSWTPATDDVIVVFSHTTNTTSISAVPAGWVNILGGTTIIEPGDTTEYLAVLYHKVTSGEATAGTTTYTITNLYAASETCMVMSAVFRGVDPTTVVDNFGTDSNAGNSTTHRLAAITGTGGALSSNSMVVSSVSADGAANYTDPGGWTMRQEQTALDPGAWLGTRDTLTTANTNVTSTNITCSLSGEMVSCSVALLEAAGGTTDVAASPTIVSPRAAIGAVAGTANIVASPTVVSPRTAVGNVGATANVVASATVVSPRTAIGNVTGGIAISASPTVVSPVAAVGNVTGHTAVAASATVVSPRTAVGNVGATANVAASATVVLSVSAVGNIGIPGVTDATPTIVHSRTAIGNVTATAGVVASATIVAPRAAVGNVTATAGVVASATVVASRTAVGDVDAVTPTTEVAATGTIVRSYVAVAGTGPDNVVATATYVLCFARTADVGSWSHLRTGRFRDTRHSWRQQRLQRLLRMPRR
jgi:hypothetical protein